MTIYDRNICSKTLIYDLYIIVKKYEYCFFCKLTHAVLVFIFGNLIAFINNSNTSINSLSTAFYFWDISL